MDGCFEKYLKLGISLESYGIYPWGEDSKPYFCTPQDAMFIGRTGVDGIHYCFAKEFGNAVLAISPYNEPGEQVHPVARNFEEFLALLIACKGEAALEQSWMWDKKKFETFCREEETTPEMEQTRQRIITDLGVIEELCPYECLEEIRAEVDCSDLCFCEDDLPEIEEEEPYLWGVQYQNQGENGREIYLNQTFCWAGREWVVPSAYLCQNGLVIDFCMKVQKETEQEYVARWGISAETENDPDFTEEEWEQLESENPLGFDFESVAEINGQESPWTQSSGTRWSGCMDGFHQPESGEHWMEHYHLDRNHCWSFTRMCYPWPDGEQPEMKSLWVRMEEEPKSRYGAKFVVHEEGETIELTNPVTQKKHLFTVLSLEKERIDPEKLPEGLLSPNYLWVMEYSLSPELAKDEFLLQDCAQADRPIQISAQGNDTLGIIGGADGPTAIFIGCSVKESTKRIVCSSLHFKPVQQVEWKPIFRMKATEHIRICLGED